ncbi:hypothetical protein SADUNF_Sadunf15G0041300 [Salix dunnii]|uniref:Uncharacterized protein n=1 Tax=Salix dunnii TaxID=1413687 RepID=A0A835JF40_9ROSI|nr:hypothetical protein SADUNF_Sadunf15G0041300 [Salix dunnii]
MVQCILRYVKGTIEIGLHFSSHTTLDLFDFSEKQHIAARFQRITNKGKEKKDDCRFQKMLNLNPIC